MLSRSCLGLLNLVSVDDCQTLSRIPRVMTVGGDIAELKISDMANSGSEELLSPVSRKRRIVVANQLPIRAIREGKKWSFEWDRDSLVLQLKDGFPKEVEVLYVGSLKAEIEASEQEEVAQTLLERFRCVSTFLPPKVYNKFYHGFCKHYLWPIWTLLMYVCKFEVS